MFKKCIIIILIIISVLFIFLSKDYWTDQKPDNYWLYNTVTPEQYDLSSNAGYEYTKQDSMTIKQFVLASLSILSNSKKLEDFQNDPVFYIEWHVPKLSLHPVLSAMFIYTHVIRKPVDDTRGLFEYYSSYLHRNDENSLWNLAQIRVYVENTFSFMPQDFQDLGLTLKRKYYLRDLPREEQLKYNYSVPISDDFSDSKIYNLIAPTSYAFYEFETVRNEHTLKATFVVSMKKELENKASGLPLSWHTLYITRE